MNIDFEKYTGIAVLVRLGAVFFIFALFLGGTTMGMQWFSHSLGKFFLSQVSNNETVFAGNLEVSASNIPAQNQEDLKMTENALPLLNWQIEDLIIGAESAISAEVSRNPEIETAKFLFKKNEEKKLPIASLSKLMTALVVLEKYPLDQKVTISQEDMVQLGEQGSLKAGQVLSVKNLLYITLIESSNRAAYALSEIMGTQNFVSLMNANAKALDLANTHFEDTTGLDSKSYSTAEDLIVLSAHLFEKYPLFKEIISFKEFNVYSEDGTFHHTLINTNKFLGEVPGVIGGKTGWTDEARGCFLVIQHLPNQTGNLAEKNYLIHIILGTDKRFEEMKKMIDWVHTAYNW